MNHGAFKVYTDPSTSTNYSAGAQITTMKETLTCANGFVTAPNQPCFWATSNTGGSDTSNGYTGIISNHLSCLCECGSHFNTSTGVFTCPVAGTYEFHGQGLIRYQTGAGRAELSSIKMVLIPLLDPMVTLILRDRVIMTTYMLWDILLVL